MGREAVSKGGWSGQICVIDGGWLLEEMVYIVLLWHYYYPNATIYKIEGEAGVNFFKHFHLKNT